MTAATTVEIVLLVVLAVLLVLLLLVLRRLQLLRGAGVDVVARPLKADGPTDARGWHTGVARYRGDEFRWYRVSGLRTTPNLVLDRTEVEIVDRRDAAPGELHGPAVTVLRCRTPSGKAWELAMPPDVLTGFSSWLEAAPPGRSTGYRQAS